MNCGKIQNGDGIERYLSGKLSEPEREEFEAHYFECDDCFALLEAARAARQVLREGGPVVVRMRPRWVWPALAIAAALLMAVVVRQAMSPAPKPGDIARQSPPAAGVSAPPLLLAEVHPPLYSPQVLRGGDQAAEMFGQAMKGYNLSDWRGTAMALDGVVQKFPHSAEAVYFRAICRLMSGETAGAVEGLSATIGQGSATPFEEEARYYRAQAYLLQGRRDDARADLDRVIAMHSDYASKAEGLEKRF
jgi:Putative zinc-finger